MGLAIERIKAMMLPGETSFSSLFIGMGLAIPSFSGCPPDH